MELSNEEKKILVQRIELAERTEVIGIIKEFSSYELKGDILGRVFEKLYVNEMGFSPRIPIETLEDIHHSFHTTNGGDWCRSKGSYLGKKYIIKRGKAHGRISSIKCDGPERQNRVVVGIRGDILSAITKRRCVILDISTNIECDHKEGRKDDARINSVDTQVITDFQPLCKTANDAKRSHCETCLATHLRYDATRLGYSVPFIHGDAHSSTCVGCYWYDPKAFNQAVSRDFKKED